MQKLVKVFFNCPICNYVLKNSFFCHIEMLRLTMRRLWLFTLSNHEFATWQLVQWVKTSNLIIRNLIAMTLLYACVAQGQSSGEFPAVNLAFKDFFQFPIGSKGLVYSHQLLDSNRKRVRLSGYMVQQEQKTPGLFLLSPRPIVMNQHADGPADDLPASTVFVELSPEQSNRIVAYTRGVIEVNGVLNLGRKEHAGGMVSWIRLELDSNRAITMNSFEYLNYKHLNQHSH